MSRVVTAHPADGTDFVGHPAAALDDVMVAAPSHGHGALEVDGARGEIIERVHRGGSEPRVGDGADDGVVDYCSVVLAFLGHHFHVAGHVHVGAFVGATEEFHHLTDVNVFVGFHREGQFGHVAVEVQRRCQLAEDEEFAVAVVLAAAVFSTEGLPEDEVALAVPEAIFLRYGFAVVGAIEILAAAFEFANAGDWR